MKLRKNLTGKMAYKSFYPSLLEGRQFCANTDRLQRLAIVFKELSARLEALSEDAKLQFINMETFDSCRLSEEGPVNPFSFALPAESVNEENIVRATVYAEDALRELPVSTRLIRNIHYLICAGPDYDKKYRGEYRTSPVWIGKPGAGLNDADFVPPVAEDMTAAIADLENYINYSEDNVFVKAAVIHYQFEMIHPFIDGNGRTGRLLNNLFLAENGALPAPVLLLSHIISRDYNRYCSEIQRVNETDDIFAWIPYWLDTLAEAADYTLRVIGD